MSCACRPLVLDGHHRLSVHLMNLFSKQLIKHYAAFIESKVFAPVLLVTSVTAVIPLSEGCTPGSTEAIPTLR